MILNRKMNLIMKMLEEKQSKTSMVDESTSIEKGDLTEDLSKMLEFDESLKTEDRIDNKKYDTTSTLVSKQTEDQQTPKIDTHLSPEMTFKRKPIQADTSQDELGSTIPIPEEQQPIPIQQDSNLETDEEQKLVHPSSPPKRNKKTWGPRKKAPKAKTENTEEPEGNPFKRPKRDQSP